MTEVITELCCPRCGHEDDPGAFDVFERSPYTLEDVLREGTQWCAARPWPYFLRFCHRVIRDDHNHDSDTVRLAVQAIAALGDGGEDYNVVARAYEAARTTRNVYLESLYDRCLAHMQYRLWSNPAIGKEDPKLTAIAKGGPVP